MSDECKKCKHYFEKEDRCIYTGGCTEKCNLFDEKKYLNSRYLNEFDVMCSNCGTIIVMAIKGYHNYCFKCGNKL